MKKLLLTLLAVSLVSIARSNDCLAFIPQTEGTTWEQTSYNKKGKEMGRMEFTLASVETKDGKTEFLVKQSSFDKKGKSIFSGDLSYTCEDGTFYADMSSFIDPKQLGMHDETEINIVADAIGFPRDLEVGQVLGDGSISMDLAMGGPINMSLRVEVQNRKVEGKESVETPAGVFECYRISQEIVTRSIVAITVKTVDWIAPGIGSVKTETYNKGGKLMNYSELTRLEKP